MALQILQKGIQISVPMDQTGFTGVIQTDVQLAVVQKMVGGRVAALNSSGVATLADGLGTSGLEALGFIINDAAGYFFENVPAVASGMIALVMGPAYLVSDQIDPSLTYAVGDRLYVGTGAKVGLIVNGLTVAQAATEGARLLGIAASVASAASPNLSFYAI